MNNDLRIKELLKDYSVEIIQAGSEWEIALEKDLRLIKKIEYSASLKVIDGEKKIWIIKKGEKFRGIIALSIDDAVSDIIKKYSDMFLYIETMVIIDSPMAILLECPKVFSAIKELSIINMPLKERNFFKGFNQIEPYRHSYNLYVSPIYYSYMRPGKKKNMLHWWFIDWNVKILRLILGRNEFDYNLERLAELKDWEKLYDSENKLDILFFEWKKQKDMLCLEASKKKLNPLKGFNQIESLVFINCGLVEMPTWIKRLKGLKNLELNRNDISGLLPIWVGNLKSLSQLDVSRNNICALSEGLEEIMSLTQLDISENELHSLPKGLEKLKKLRQLNAGGNKMDVLPERLGTLKDLTKLNISMNELSALPEWLGDLKSIRELDVGGNELSVLPEELAELKDLTKLNISRNELNALPEWLEELKSLRELDVSGNKLDVFPEGLAELKGLTKFNISGNELIALPEELGELKNLRELDVSGNKLDILPEGLAELKDLTKLDISGNKLSAVPEGLGELKSLRELDVSGNKLDVLPEGLANLKNLAKLDVRGNLITSLPKFLFEMGLEIEIGEDYYIRGIIIDNNVQSPPLSVIEAGRQNVLEWFSLQRQPMHEMRVILLGLAEAGKTSLVDALTGKIFNAHQDSTQGIQITPFTYGETKINYWDFGGQEVYFSTHKFFLSEDCIYIVVIDGRKDQLPDKWLEQVKAFGDSSDTMIVANKTDQNPNIDITVSKAKYPFIKEKQWISCKTRENTGELKHHLLRMVHNHPAYKKEYPADWINIKSDIEKSNKKYLTRDEYKSICSEHNVSEASKQKELLKVLHNLGTIHHFEDIEDKQILKSSYITDAVYAIVNNSDYFDKDCGISKRDIRKILIDSNV